MKNFKELFALSAPGIFVASLCCLAPIVLVAFGLSTLSFAIALTDTLDGKYKWAFLLAGLLFMVVSLVRYFRGRGICTIDQAKKHRTEIINKVLLVLMASVLGYIIFFYGILGYIGQQLSLWK
ncbi:MAG TPA: hypothetical protein VFG51_00770 [Candidatus Saccharimonadia bacterium]|nr:hypothetical protein [Candidatus Saccharimonadia bacterium]